MAYRSKYRGNFDGIGRLLKHPGVQLACRRAALEVKEAAEARAPVGNPDSDRHSGLYKRSFDVIPIEKNVPWRGKPRRRAGARVINTAPHALVVEYGNGVTPRHAVFQKAIEDVAARFR
ncbi:hypothetical protein OG784_27380 [Streptomyces sp. NBC_01617]|uniref:hypothetical protein n=1 Tax=Streptomyces sp. NBC_01617 TaxID=2975899 RepID=UPI003863BEF9|nr:hypothetical protein OG784_27380 [Streptomyces sp. NBC_01617]